jgi:hypothetical protein
MVWTVTVPLANLNEFERIQGTVKLVGSLGLNRSGETIDGNCGERVLGEEAIGCEVRRSNDDDVCSINIVQRELCISILSIAASSSSTEKRQPASPYSTIAPADPKCPLSIINCKYILHKH